MQVYVAVVDAHSFARAAEVPGQPRSTVSRGGEASSAWLKCSFSSAPPASQRDGGRVVPVHEEVKGCWPRWRRWKPFSGRSAQLAGRFKVGMPQSLARHCILPRIGESFCSSIPTRADPSARGDNVEDIIQEEPT
ncbi:hypothetical protein MJ561_13225 [Klebsiella pneumoniae]|nr:hypothetical protein MJ561_13225 [Klebsiella pneumoniae]